MEERLKKQMEFILEVDKIKFIGRQTYLSDGERKENDAEHSWHLALMTALLSEHANEKIDVRKTMLMVLVHDIVEIDAGDTYAYDAAGNATKRERELKAAKRIFHLLPEDQAEELFQLWEEFEACETPEAKFAHSMDNIQPIMLNDATGGKAWREHQVKKSQVEKRQESTRAGSETIMEVAEEIIRRNVENGNLKNE
ncbi:MAG: HD domain-containing protein [Firmicutes bacterium]|nr:HD domain-containing protein [Blautia sp.]MDD7371761.1 HD domain-containing protein [Bacillota bacterium]MDY3715461.1 HD domain-containing protein [Blautia sp.]